jgi:hypothetical protein
MYYYIRGPTGGKIFSVRTLFEDAIALSYGSKLLGMSVLRYAIQVPFQFQLEKTYKRWNSAIYQITSSFI